MLCGSHIKICNLANPMKQDCRYYDPKARNGWKFGQKISSKSSNDKFTKENGLIFSPFLSCQSQFLEAPLVRQAEGELKKWNKEHQTFSFQFFINTFSILMFFVLFFHVVCKISISSWMKNGHEPSRAENPSAQAHHYRLCFIKGAHRWTLLEKTLSLLLSSVY